MRKNLGVVICNFNKKDYLKGCLETLFKSNFENYTYDVIIVDNASTDGSSQFVKENYSSVILLQNEINTGGSGGFDRGIKYCIENKYEYVSLLDNDILLEEDTIINLLNYIRANPKVGVVGSKICTMDNPEILQELGSFIDWENDFNIKTPFKGHKDDENLPNTVNCDYVPACCLLTTKEVLNCVGSFNTDHFIYWDDMDWCTRVKKAGWEIHAINSSRVFHKMGVVNHLNTFGTYYFHRNRIMFFLKHLERNKINKFIENTCDWLTVITFLSNHKGLYSKVISVLSAIDDLVLKRLGKQEDSIFLIEKQKSLIEKFYIKKNTKILIVSNNKTTSNLLNGYFKDYDITNTENINYNFSNYDVIFITCNNILKIKEMPLGRNIIFIDSYLNYCYSLKYNDFLRSYENYKELFNNIYKPTFIKKLIDIYEV